MANKTLDLDDYISLRKEKEPEFAKDFDTGYEELKIGMMIKEMRLESGMTQEQLAEKLETKKSVISRMENHSEDIRLSTLQKVASVFGKQLRVAMLSICHNKKFKVDTGSRPRDLSNFYLDTLYLRRFCPFRTHGLNKENIKIPGKS